MLAGLPDLDLEGDGDLDLLSDDDLLLSEDLERDLLGEIAILNIHFEGPQLKLPVRI